MKYFLLWYWFFASILMGMAAGWHKNKCPNEPEPSAVEELAGIIALPGVIGYGFYRWGAPAEACKVEVKP